MEPTTTAAKEAATKPVQVFRRDALSVSVFANAATRDGKPSVFHKVTISKTYKKKDSDGFARTSSFEAKDFPKICSLLTQAGSYIEEVEGADGGKPTGA
jgi:hypothetical protein